MRTGFKVIGQRSRSPGWLMLRLEVCHIFRTERPTKFKLLVSLTSAMTTNVKGEGRDVTWCVWQVLAVNRERKAPGTPKLVGRLPITRTITNTTFKVKRQGSRSLGHRTKKVRHLLNKNAYQLETWYTVEAWRAATRAVPWPPESKVVVTRLCGPSNRCWPIRRELNVSGTAKLV